MPKTITIKAPTNQGLIDITGKVCIFKIGDKRIKFFIQDSKHGSEKFLTHYASGMKIQSLTPIKIAAYRSYSSLTDRAAAEIAIKKVIEKNGIERFFQTLDQAKIINHR